MSVAIAGLVGAVIGSLSFLAIRAGVEKWRMARWLKKENKRIAEEHARRQAELDAEARVRARQWAEL